MPGKLESVLETELKSLEKEGRLKGAEKVIAGTLPSSNGGGNKIQLEDGRLLLNFASNSYLGLSGDKRIADAEHHSSLKYGAGPGAVRFISGTQLPHVQLEKKLAQFFNKQAAIIFSSAYASNLGTIAPLVTRDTMVISDQLNHNSIIMAIRLAGIPREKKKIYSHCDAEKLRQCLDETVGDAKRVIIATDGVFSMRGNYAPLDQILTLSQQYEKHFDEGIIT
ncbi:MAG: aminotransferase class I/II-fold pyridoxal phosphate-dependent enzyme, partial [Spirochaetota bacterium]